MKFFERVSIFSCHVSSRNHHSMICEKRFEALTAPVGGSIQKSERESDVAIQMAASIDTQAEKKPLETCEFRSASLSSNSYNAGFKGENARHTNLFKLGSYLIQEPRTQQINLNPSSAMNHMAMLSLEI